MHPILGIGTSQPLTKGVGTAVEILAVHGAPMRARDASPRAQGSAGRALVGACPASVNGLHAPGTSQDGATPMPSSLRWTMRVEERTLILKVTSADNRPSRLFQMAWARDMLFAAC